MSGSGSRPGSVESQVKDSPSEDVFCSPPMNSSSLEQEYCDYYARMKKRKAGPDCFGENDRRSVNSLPTYLCNNRITSAFSTDQVFSKIHFRSVYSDLSPKKQSRSLFLDSPSSIAREISSDDSPESPYSWPALHVDFNSPHNIAVSPNPPNDS